MTINIFGTNDAPVVSGLSISEATISFLISDPDSGLSLASPFDALFGAISSDLVTAWAPTALASSLSGQLQATDQIATPVDIVGLYLGTSSGDIAIAPLSNAANAMFGFSGDDQMSGGTAADFIFGGFNNDTIVGNGGADTLIGGTGNRLLMRTIRLVR